MLPFFTYTSQENKNDSLWHCVKKQAMIFSIVTATAENITKSSDILVSIMVHNLYEQATGTLLGSKSLFCLHYK